MPVQGRSCEGSCGGSSVVAEIVLGVSLSLSCGCSSVTGGVGTSGGGVCNRADGTDNWEHGWELDCDYE